MIQHYKGQSHASPRYSFKTFSWWRLSWNVICWQFNSIFLHPPGRWGLYLWKRSIWRHVDLFPTCALGRRGLSKKNFLDKQKDSLFSASYKYLNVKRAWRRCKTNKWFWIDHLKSDIGFDAPLLSIESAQSESVQLTKSLLAPSGALITIPTYYWSTTTTTHPTFSDHTGPQHWTFTFWATTAI